MLAANGTVMSSSVGKPEYVDYYYENANGMDTKSCYGFLQATYTSDGGTTCCLLTCIESLAKLKGFPATSHQSHSQQEDQWEKDRELQRHLTSSWLQVPPTSVTTRWTTWWTMPHQQLDLWVFGLLTKLITPLINPCSSKVRLSFFHKR